MTSPQDSHRPRRLGRLLFIGLAGVIALAGVAYGGWWAYLATTVESGIQQWARANRAHGATVEYSLDVGGFPTRVEAVAQDFSIHRPDGWSWQGPRLVVRTKPWQVQTILLEFDGEHRLRLPGRAGLPVAVSFKGGDGRIGLASTGALTTGTLTLSALALAQSGFPSARSEDRGAIGFGDPRALGIGTISADVFQAPTAVEATDRAGARLTVDAADVRLPEAIASPLGTVIEGIRLDASLMGLPGAFSAAEVARWSTRGGQLRLDSFDLRWGPLALAATGFVSLDPNLHYVGKIDAEIMGLAATIDALVEAGLLDERRAGLVKAFARGLAAGNPEPGAPVKLPFLIGNGFLQFGPFKLVALPPPPFG